MRRFHWLPISLVLSGSLYSTETKPAEETKTKETKLTENDNYDGSAQEPKLFVIKQSSEPAGTTYTLTSDVTIQNVSSATESPPQQPEPQPKPEPEVKPEQQEQQSQQQESSSSSSSTITEIPPPTTPPTTTPTTTTETTSPTTTTTTETPTPTPTTTETTTPTTTTQTTSTSTNTSVLAFSLATTEAQQSPENGQGQENQENEEEEEEEEKKQEAEESVGPDSGPEQDQGKKDTSCFINSKGDLTFKGGGFSLTFENISLTGKGAVISNNVADSSGSSDPESPAEESSEEARVESGSSGGDASTTGSSSISSGINGIQGPRATTNQKTDEESLGDSVSSSDSEGKDTKNNEESVKAQQEESQDPALPSEKAKSAEEPGAAAALGSPVALPSKADEPKEKEAAPAPEHLTTLTFKDFANLSFINAPGDSVEGGQGAIFVTNSGKSLTVFSNNDSVLFRGNCFKTGSGGAISTDQLRIENTKTKLTFENNIAKTGGAIFLSGGEGSINKNASILFSGNKAEVSSEAKAKNAEQSSETPNRDGCGGALFSYINTSNGASQTGVHLSNNQDVTFSGNTASEKGGAIYATKFTCDNNKELIFSNNTAGSEGGAIYAKTLIITAGGTTTFSNNSAGSSVTSPKAPEKPDAKKPEEAVEQAEGESEADQKVFGKGGAIAIEAGGSLTLFAKDGDIIFKGNTITNSNGEAVPNAIHIGSGADIFLQASSGHTIYFYDPITIEDPKTSDTSKFVINPPTVTPAKVSSPESSYLRMAATTAQGAGAVANTGAVVFSGEQLSAGLAGGATSTINQAIDLQNGTLVLKDGATLAVQSLTQNPNSMILMDAGTTLEAIAPAAKAGGGAATGGNLTITNLAVNLDSVTPTSKPIKINANGGTLTLSGDLQYRSSDGMYQNPLLASNMNVQLFDLPENANISNFRMVPSGAGVDSGYQGTWALQPTKTPDGKTVLTAVWKAAGYRPNTTQSAFLVPNSLWGLSRDALAIQEAISTSINAKISRSLWSSSVSNFFHRDRQQDLGSGFRHINAGYLVGGNIETPSHNVFAFAVAQLFGKSKDYNLSDIKSRTYAGALYAQHIHPLVLPEFLRNHLFSRVLPKFPKDVDSIMKAQVVYARTYNDMKTKYTTTPGKSSWTNHCVAVEAANFVPMQTRHHFVNTVSPFVKLQVVYANQDSFAEVAAPDNARTFSNSHLVNVSIPFGLCMEKGSPSSPHTLSLKLTYNIDIYRNEPKCLVSMPTSGISWTTFATDLARQGVSAQASSRHRVSKNVELFSHGGCDLRSSSRGYNADCGAKYYF
ncbi:autotransporter beta-domain protein [Chlamydia pecorum]|uniref:Autotransporter beta-domain protein n=1 Tax=Chlamydia pecorum TaxID=85991 RepID=A0AA40PQ70_9CHLA|nr:polymorphic outer membrane protein middle domain-containing protein [Chlamydia pecorum]KTF28518.1 autotransporter beta-domain protein [Chlamydia pecorum]